MPVSFDCDLAIIGSGPAGSTLARLVDSSIRTIIIDKKKETPESFEKPCGGLLAPDAQRALSRYNITLPKDVLVDPQIFSVKTIDLRSGLVRHYQRCYINMDRHKFDMWLCGMIPPHVKRTEGLCMDITPVNGGYSIEYSRDGTHHSITTKYIVGADGANSIVRNKLFPNKKLRSYTAIQQWFVCDDQTPFYSCIFDPDTSDCCSWSISKDEYFIFGGAFPAQESRSRFETQKKKLMAMGFPLEIPVKTEACVVLRPRSFHDFCIGANNAFLIGEAAGFISPSSLEGISYAMESADMLSTALSSSNPAAKYRRKTLKLRIKLGLKVLKCPFMYHPFLRRLVMKSGIQSIKVK